MKVCLSYELKRNYIIFQLKEIGTMTSDMELEAISIKKEMFILDNGIKSL